MSARATHLKAVAENVSVTTIERKQMSNKTNFKRIALAVVAALGFGVLASGPSSAQVQAGATLTIAAPTASITAGETATVALTGTFTSIGTADSMSVTYVRTAGTSNGGATITLGAATVFDTVAVASHSNVSSTGTQATSYWGVSDPDAQATMKWQFTFATPTTAGTYTYTFYPAFSTTATLPTPVTYTITVAAKDVKPSATYSKAYLAFGTYYSATPKADSTVVVARTANTQAGWIAFDQRNASDTNTVTGTSVWESVTASIAGPGFISRDDGTTKVRSLTTILPNETITVFADGTAGVGTITLTTTSMTTWTSKSVTFAGALATASLTASKTTTAAGNSDTSTVLRAVLKDSGENLVTSATTMYIHSSDTKVVNNASCSVTVSASLGYGNCALSIVDSGTAKVKIANYAFGATVPTTPVVSNEVDIIIAGAPGKVAIAFDKRTYVPGEKAVITVTVTDGLGRGVADQTIVSLFATGGITVSPALTSGTVSGETVTVTAATHGQGAFKYTVNMPSIGGQVVASATGGTGLVAAGRVAVADTVTVTDPAEDAANSALDAAQEATDAAIAATDAAILAQEAADEAASAAIAAQETAQAAVDAVTALSAEVTKLVAQLATLQKLLNRVAKRVGVKL